jgi:hypothetical protein
MYLTFDGRPNPAKPIRLTTVELDADPDETRSVSKTFAARACPPEHCRGQPLKRATPAVSSATAGRDRQAQLRRIDQAKSKATPVLHAR